MPQKPWPTSPAELEHLQEEIAELGRWAEAWRPPSGGFRPGGAFVTSSTPDDRGGERGWAAAVLLDGLRPRAGVVVVSAPPAPYVPGLLALREGALYEAAVRGLPGPPDVLLVNATGLDHPRRAGLAVHLGAVCDLPTVGVTDRTLVAEAGEPGPEAGDVAPLTLTGELVGYRLRTRPGIRPVCVHAGFRTGPETARDAALATVGRSRTPEPIRRARELARTTRAVDEGRAPSDRIPPWGRRR